jgi:hypothetical protein
MSEVPEALLRQKNGMSIKKGAHEASARCYAELVET